MFNPPAIAPHFLYPPGFREGYWRNPDGLRLRFGTLENHQNPDATIILGGGLGEFTEKYLHWMTQFDRLGYNTISINFIDQGGSDIRLLHKPDRRHAVNFQAQDARDLIGITKYLTSPLEPVFYIGHSMGALIGSLAAKVKPKLFNGTVLSTPLWGFAHWKARLIGENILSRIPLTQTASEDFALKNGPWVPRNHIDSDHPPHAYSHDLTLMYLHDHWMEINPGLRSRPITKGFVKAAAQAMVSLRQPGVAESITTPLQLFSAGQDRIVDNSAIFNLAARLPQCNHRHFPTARHEIFMEDEDHAPVLPIIHSFIQQYRR